MTRLLVSGDDRIGLVDWNAGTTRLISMPAAYRFDGAAALGSTQPVRTFGLSWHSDRILVACHERIGMLDAELCHRGFLGISALWFMTHAIAVRDDVLYSCNARIDVLGIHDLRSGEETFLHVGERRAVPNPQHLKPLADGYEHDRLHPNAVVVAREQIAVLTHPFDEDRMCSQVGVFDRTTFEPVGELHLDDRPLGTPYAHDLALIEEVAIWCDTYRCRVRATDGRSSAPLGDDTMFLRGLALDDAHVYVGCASRRGAAEPSAWLVRLDASTFAEVDRRAVPFPVEICAVRIIDGVDLAHPGVGPAPPLRSAL